MNTESLNQLILQQEKEITGIQQKIEKVRAISKYRSEHVSRLEKKYESLIAEKNQLSEQKQKLSHELKSFSSIDVQTAAVQKDVENAVTLK